MNFVSFTTHISETKFYKDSEGMYQINCIPGLYNLIAEIVINTDEINARIDCLRRIYFCSEEFVLYHIKQEQIDEWKLLCEKYVLNPENFKNLNSINLVPKKIEIKIPGL